MRFICIYKLYAKVKTLFQIKFKFQLLLDLTWRVCSNYCKFHGFYIMWTQDTLRPCQLKQALCEKKIYVCDYCRAKWMPCSNQSTNRRTCAPISKLPFTKSTKAIKTLLSYGVYVYKLYAKDRIRTVFKIRIKFQFQKSILLDLTHITYIRW